MTLLKNINLVSLPITPAGWEPSKAFYRETLGLRETFVADDFGWAQYGWEGGAEVALSRWDEGTPARTGGPIIVFTVDDALAAVAELRRRGVRCDDPVGVPGMVTYATFYDVEGNQLQLAGPPPAA
ncbi:MAG: VOC family protein [Anaerolineales bacterium]|nr:VOC family protein [Anaerolineales bacterium]